MRMSSSKSCPGSDTIVGEGAARLSVGEKQRLNLARAFLKDAPILLLDEPPARSMPRAKPRWWRFWVN